jgi:hypothetical protein
MVWNANADLYPKYSDATATHIAKELLDGATEDTVIAAVSAPSVFVALKNLIVSVSSHPPLIMSGPNKEPLNA